MPWCKLTVKTTYVPLPAGIEGIDIWEVLMQVRRVLMRTKDFLSGLSYKLFYHPCPGCLWMAIAVPNRSLS